MIKAIIFDCFGVLVEPSLEPFCEKYFPGNVEKLARVKELDGLSNRGQMTYAVFVAELAKLAAIEPEKAASFLDKNPPNVELLSYIHSELKPHYKIGFLSNASDNWLDELFTAEQRALFDDFVLSFEHGIAKPESEIFQLSAQRLGVQPSECLFVDDIERYCDGARAVGMKAVVFTGTGALKTEISKL